MTRQEFLVSKISDCRKDPLAIAGHTSIHNGLVLSFRLGQIGDIRVTAAIYGQRLFDAPVVGIEEAIEAGFTIKEG